MNASTLPTWAAKVESLESRLEAVRLTPDERNALTWADSTLMDSIDTAMKTGNSEWATRSREAVFVIRRLIQRLA